MIEFQIDEERCTQCGECADICPAGVISMDEYPSIINEEECYCCQHCLAICPTGAVSILGRNPDACMELEGNMVDPSRLETLIKGRRSVRRYNDRDLNLKLPAQVHAVRFFIIERLPDHLAISQFRRE